MKTRIVKTDFWKKQAKSEVPKDARMLFIYLITCMHNNLCGTFELPDVYICLETGLTPGELNKAKEYLHKNNKAYFYQDWVRIVNSDEHNNYKLSKKTQVAYERELEEIPSSIGKYFDSCSDSTIDTTTDSSSDSLNKHKTENIKHIERESVREKTNTLDYLKELPQEDIDAFHASYEVDKAKIRETAERMILYCQSKAKSYKNYRAAMQSWLLDKYGKRKTPLKPKVDYVYKDGKYVAVTSSPSRP